MINMFKKRKKLIIVRLDAIGDYVLFRNFLTEIREYYYDYQITLLGNKDWKDIAEHFDKKYVDKFLWLDKKMYKENEKYIRKFDRILKKKEFDVLLSSVYSRDNWILEPIINQINAKEKIASSGDLTNITGAQLAFANLNYTKIIQEDEKPCFEFFRNIDFFSKLINKKININKPYFELKNTLKYDFMKNQYAVIFPGAFLGFREWNINNYIKVTRFIIDKYNLKIILAGSHVDKERCLQIENDLNSENIINLVGKTKLYELPYIFKNAEFVLSGDTCAYHFSVGVDTQTFCVSNGNTFCRFLPYPKEIFNDVYYAYPPEIEEHLKDFCFLTKKYIYASTVDINKIEADIVINLIKTNYKSKKGNFVG